MATMQTTGRNDLLERSCTFPKPMNYSMTQVLRAHQKVGVLSYPSWLLSVRKGICDKESLEIVGTTP